MSAQPQSVAAALLASLPVNLDMKGGGTWAPARDPKGSYKKWGVWEAWEVFRIGKINECLVGPIATGDWCAWNSQTGAQLGFMPMSGKSAKWQAEVCAISQNQGMPTRVVSGCGRAVASEITSREVNGLLREAVQEYDRAHADDA